jgi:hypothetical protein
MGFAAQIERPIQRSRWAPFLVIGLALAVLGGTLAWSALDLRTRIHTQIVQRDGEILDAVTLMQHLNDQNNGGTIASLTDPGEQFQLALEVSRLRNVLGVRLFDATGKFVNAFPAYITETALPVSTRCWRNKTCWPKRTIPRRRCCSWKCRCARRANRSSPG